MRMQILAWVAVALRATMESENVLSIHRRTECDGYPCEYLHLSLIHI